LANKSDEELDKHGLFGSIWKNGGNWLGNSSLGQMLEGTYGHNREGEDAEEKSRKISEAMRRNPGSRASAPAASTSSGAPMAPPLVRLPVALSVVSPAVAHAASMGTTSMPARSKAPAGVPAAEVLSGSIWEMAARLSGASDRTTGSTDSAQMPQAPNSFQTALDEMFRAGVNDSGGDALGGSMFNPYANSKGYADTEGAFARTNPQALQNLTIDSFGKLVSPAVRQAATMQQSFQGGAGRGGKGSGRSGARDITVTAQNVVTRDSDGTTRVKVIVPEIVIPEERNSFSRSMNSIR
jgi:hypothetical protein